MRQVTCMDCLEVMKDAVYCQRCSHTGCRRCLDVDDSGMCKDCMCATLPRESCPFLVQDERASALAHRAEARRAGVSMTSPMVSPPLLIGTSWVCTPCFSLF